MEKFRLNIELIFIALLMIAIIPQAHCLGEGTPYIPTEEGVYYRVDLINETIWEMWEFKLEHFWNLTNADPDILRAIRNPGVFVKTNLTSSNPPPGTFFYEYYDHDCNPYFTYNGSYYGMHRGVQSIFYDGQKNTEGSGLYCSVTLLDEEPEDPENYTILINPDPYTLAAVEHPGTLILFDTYYLLDHPDEQSLRNIGRFKYQSKYYQRSHMLWIDAYPIPPTDWSKEIAAGIGMLAVAITIVALIIYRERKNNQYQKNS